MPLESSLEQKFQRRVRVLGGKALKLMPTEKGVPDRLVIMPGGHMFLVELKEEEPVSAAQKVWHDRCSELGVDVVVLRGWEECVVWIRQVFLLACPESEDEDLAHTG